MAKTKKFIVRYNGEVVDGDNNDLKYYYTICNIGVEKVYSLNLMYEKDGDEIPIILDNRKTFPAGFTGNIVRPEKKYRVVCLRSDETRRQYLLKIKSLLGLTDEELTVE